MNAETDVENGLRRLAQTSHAARWECQEARYTLGLAATLMRSRRLPQIPLWSTGTAVGIT